METMENIATGVATTARTIAVEHDSGEWERAAWRLRALSELARDMAHQLQADAVAAGAADDTLARIGVAVSAAPRDVAEDVVDDETFGELVSAAGEHSPGVVRAALQDVCSTREGVDTLLWGVSPARMLSAEVAAMLRRVQPS